MAKSSTSFDGDKQPEDRKPRGKGKKSLMLDAIREECGDEHEFFKKVVSIGIGDPENEIAPNPALLTMVINRIEPPLKSVSPFIKFKFTKNADPHNQCLEIIEGMSKGEVPPDVGLMIIGSFSNMLKIKEVTDIDDRLKAMEEKIDAPE